MRRRVPRGKLLVIGGGEDKGSYESPNLAYRIQNFEHFEILKQLLPPKGRRGKIEIITTATSHPDVQDMRYKKAFDEMGFDRFGFMHIINHEEASCDEYIKRIKKAHAVFFTGGDQFVLSTTLGNTAVLEIIHNRYLNEEDFVVAGTSAGAMAAGNLMMYEGENNEALLKGTVKISSGLGFVNRCLFDTHFVKRGRFGRLAQAVIMNPRCVGIGLGEDTAMMITKGNEAKCYGSGMITIIDGSDVRHTNIAYAESEAPLCIENLRVHILCKGSTFLLDTRTVVPSPEDMKKERLALSYK